MKRMQHGRGTSKQWHGGHEGDLVHCESETEWLTKVCDQRKECVEGLTRKETRTSTGSRTAPLVKL